MDQIHPQVAKRVGLRISSSDPHVGVTFFSTRTGIGVDLSIEEAYLTVVTEKVALGELYLHLKQTIEESPEKFGFSKQA